MSGEGIYVQQKKSKEWSLTDLKVTFKLNGEASLSFLRVIAHHSP